MYIIILLRASFAWILLKESDSAQIIYNSQAERHADFLKGSITFQLMRYSFKLVSIFKWLPANSSDSYGQKGNINEWSKMGSPPVRLVGSCRAKIWFCKRKYISGVYVKTSDHTMLARSSVTKQLCVCIAVLYLKYIYTYIPQYSSFFQTNHWLMNYMQIMRYDNACLNHRAN